MTMREMSKVDPEKQLTLREIEVFESLHFVIVHLQYIGLHYLLGCKQMYSNLSCYTYTNHSPHHTLQNTSARLFLKLKNPERLQKVDTFIPRSDHCCTSFYITSWKATACKPTYWLSFSQNQYLSIEYCIMSCITHCKMISKFLQYLILYELHLAR